MLLNMIVVLEEKWIFIWKKLLLLSLFDYTDKAKKKKFTYDRFIYESTKIKDQVTLILMKISRNDVNQIFSSLVVNRSLVPK